MKRFQHLHKKIKMSHAEKEHLRANLHVIMRERPIMEQAVSQKTMYGFRGLFSRPLRAVSGAFVFLILAGGSVAYASEKAIPGDVLYPIKININEKVKTAFATTAHAKAKLHVALANERLQEAETLATEGKLNATTTVALARSFKRHADAAKAESKQDRVKATSTGISIENDTGLDVALKAHERILARLINKKVTAKAVQKISVQDQKKETKIKMIEVKEAIETREATSSEDHILPLVVEVTAQIREEEAVATSSKTERAIEKKIQDVETFIKSHRSRDEKVNVEINEKLSL